MSSPATQAIEIVGGLTAIPPLLFAVIAAQPQRRRDKRMEAMDLPFGAEIAPEAPRLLRRFNGPQRAWIRRQLPVIAAAPMFCWMFTVYFSAGLLPQYLVAHADQPLPLRVWWSFLSHICSNVIVYAVFAVVAGAIALLELTQTARFLRTRPISWSFVFWTRVSTALAMLVTSLVVAAGLSVLLLLALRGPVWKQLADTPHAAAIVASAPTQPGPSFDDTLGDIYGQHHLLWAAQTSLPRLFLSILTTMALGFSVFIAIAMVPIPNKYWRILFIVISLYALLFTYLNYVFGESNLPSSVERALFLYVHPGPAPPWAFALGPLLISAALLALAGGLNQHYEG